MKCITGEKEARCRSHACLCAQDWHSASHSLVMASKWNQIKQLAWSGGKAGPVYANNTPLADVPQRLLAHRHTNISPHVLVPIQGMILLSLHLRLLFIQCVYNLIWQTSASGKQVKKRMIEMSCSTTEGEPTKWMCNLKIQYHFINARRRGCVPNVLLYPTLKIKRIIKRIQEFDHDRVSLDWNPNHKSLWFT